MKTADKIRQLRLSKSLSQEALGEMVGVKKAAINKYETGRVVNIKRTTLQKLADALGVSPADLLDDKEESNVIPVSIGKTISIPVYGRIPAGSPAEAMEYIEDYIDVPLSMAKGKELLALKVVGDSMYPKYIEGDYVLIQKQPDCESGQDCAVRVNGSDVTLKKVIKERDGIMLQPINPEYAPKKYDYTDEFNPVYIIGIVIELRRKV